MGEIKFSSVLGPKIGRRHIGYIYSMSNYLRNSIMLGTGILSFIKGSVASWPCRWALATSNSTDNVDRRIEWGVI